MLDFGSKMIFKILLSVIKMAEEQNLIIFNLFTKFVSELNTSFGSKQRSLQLYNRLITRTAIVHVHAIQKHVETIKTFCIENREAISTKNFNKLVNNIIKYSEKVNIDIKEIFKIADKEEKEVIWKHILMLSAYVDPSNKAKEILKESINKSGSGENEEEFLTNIINKVESSVDPNANPMQAVSGILSSGIFTDLVGNMNSGLQNGDLNLGKLLGTVQNMIGSLGNMGEGMTGEAPSGMPDLSNMMNQMTGMMSQLNSQTTQEDDSKKKKRKHRRKKSNKVDKPKEPEVSSIQEEDTSLNIPEQEHCSIVEIDDKE